MSENKTERKYPVGVVDKVSYEEYLKGRKEYENDPTRFLQTSDPKIVIDCLVSVPICRKMIKTLPDTEQGEIIKRVSEFKSKVSKVTMLKRKAFDQFGRNSDGNSFGMLTHKIPEILELFGKYYKLGEVYEIVVKQWGYEHITYYHIEKLYRENIEKIEQLQKKFREEYTDVRLGYKKSRLEELQLLYNKRKFKWLESQSLSDEKQLQALLESIKREIDGDLVVSGKMKIEIEQNTNYLIQHEILKNFNITSYIVSKLASRLGVNPVLIITRLLTSRYSKFTGFGPLSETRMEDDIDYPSTIVYNWEQIEEVYNLNTEKEKELRKFPVLDVEVIEETQNVKSQLLEKLKNMKKPLEESKENLKD